MFKNSLRQLRESKGYSMEELARLYNSTYNAKMNKSTLSRYENGLQEPMYSTASNLAKLFGVSVDELVNEDLSFPGVLPLPKTYKVPLLGDIACGSPITAVEDIEAMVNVPEYIHVDFALRCKGDSMINARIFDGDIVYIHKQEEVENGEIAAVMIADSAEMTEATLKRVYFSGEQLILQAENPTFSPIMFSGEDINQVRILGKAVAVLSGIR